LFLTAPAVDLVTLLAPESDERRYDSYLRLGIVADAARYADVIDIQAQGSERNTRVYADFVGRQRYKRGRRTRTYWCSPGSAPIQAASE
jgi:hypothetical protein